MERLADNIDAGKVTISGVIREIFYGKTISRAIQNHMIKGMRFAGRVVDLGARNSSSNYYRFINVKNAEMTFCDYFSDDPSIVKVNLEEKLPFGDNEFDHVFLIHVLEHIYNTDLMLGEIARICKKEALIVVPFILHYHPDPNDYYRFTGAALERKLKDAGFKHVSIHPWGHGPFTLALTHIQRPLKIKSVVAAMYVIARGLDFILSKAFPSMVNDIGVMGYICVVSRD